MRLQRMQEQSLPRSPLHQKSCFAQTDNGKARRLEVPATKTGLSLQSNLGRMGLVEPVSQTLHTGTGQPVAMGKSRLSADGEPKPDLLGELQTMIETKVRESRGLGYYLMVIKREGKTETQKAARKQIDVFHFYAHLLSSLTDDVKEDLAPYLKVALVDEDGKVFSP